MCIVDRPRQLHSAFCDDEVSIAHKLDVDAVPLLLVYVLPLPLMRCLYMHMSAVDNPNMLPKSKNLHFVWLMWLSFGNETD